MRGVLGEAKPRLFSEERWGVKGAPHQVPVICPVWRSSALCPPRMPVSGHWSLLLMLGHKGAPSTFSAS